MHQTDQPASLLQRHRQGILLVVTSFFWFAMYTYPTFLTPYLTELGASLTLSGLVVGSYGLTQTLVRLPLGILSDRLRNKRVFIIIGMAFSLISALGLYLVRNVALILLFRAMTGLSAATWVHITTLYLTYQPAGKASRAMGNLNFISNIGSVCAMLAGGFLAQAFGWQAAFLAAVAGAAIGLLLSLTLSEEPAKAEPVQAFSLRESFLVGRDRLLFWTSILALLSQLSTFATMQGFVPQYASILGADKAQLGLLSAFSVLPRAIASLIGGSLLARYFRLRSLIVIGFVMTGLVACALPLIDNLLPLLFSQVIAGTGLGIQFSLLMSLCKQTIPAERKGSAMGFFQSVYGIGMIIGPILVGALADAFSLGTGFVIIGVMTLLTAGLAAWSLRTYA
ncbi:MAG: MFS transporter [Clostridiaceae bacterium]|nr:MFS transporter [Clostridiaceae bacterium]